MAADFAQLGVVVPAAEIVEDDDDLYEIWDSNADALRVFLASATQWRVAAVSTMSAARVVRLGLVYEAVDVVMRRLRLRDRDGHVFRGVLALEAYALEAFAEADA